MQPSGIITLTTDFGQTDSYIGIMKGVILSVARSVQIVDVTHEINPQDIHQAAYTVQTFHRYFPRGTVHVVVVDPGVGSDCRHIAFGTPEALFVAPDNGVLTYAWRDAVSRFGADRCEVVELSNRRFWLPQVSSTFHGRDIFAPVGAHLASGVPLHDLGPRLDAPVEASLEQPGPGRKGGLVGRIIHVDHFGNCITNITPAHLEEAGLGVDVLVEIIDQCVQGLHRTYGDAAVGDLIALIGSNERLELAVRNGSAARTLGVGVGDPVRVHT